MVLVHLDDVPLTKTLAAAMAFPDLLGDRTHDGKKRNMSSDMPTVINVMKQCDSDDDALLDELLEDDLRVDPDDRSPGGKLYFDGDHDRRNTRERKTGPSSTSSHGEKEFKEGQRSSRSNNTSSTHSRETSSGGDAEHVGLEDVVVLYESDEDDDYSRNVSSSVCSIRTSESEKSGATNILLERAHERIAMQQLQDEIVTLQAIISKKNEEIEQLSGQLRRAVATKCDLVIAHTVLERHHDFNLGQKEEEIKCKEKEITKLKEEHFVVEKQVLDELVKKTDELNEMVKNQSQELEDWERMHRNEMLEKDFKIAQLTEELRALKFGGSEGDGLWKHEGKPHGKKSGIRVMFRKN